MNGNTEVVKALLKEDCTLVHALSEDGWSALHLAAYFGHEETVKVLIEFGADVHLKAKNNNGNIPLHAAVANKQLTIVKLLLEHGTDVHTTQSGGWTSLHEAALLGATDIVQVLIDNGADVHKTKDDGKSALDVAIEKEQEAVIQLLQRVSTTR
ncbi:ankyrin repeat domain-containing protein [Priestia taiwanensis]|uniref:Phosphocholine transferase AnkX n=1 Tax=Priestia taiwanensis TaxID=1347902 RepID=A0A917AP53_9BACI|nr:ankyrin repeat protein [Priestia taiwanensis]GGE63787.1 hypothetical protein GCM10007140_12530 [Priestia taiwanensis]